MSTSGVALREEVVGGVCQSDGVTDDSTWRPFSVESDEEVATYDALHDGVPAWMHTGLWAWIKEAIATLYSDERGRRGWGPNVPLCEQMAEVLQFPFPNLRDTDYYRAGISSSSAMAALETAKKPLHIADFLLSHSERADQSVLETLLGRSKSLWQVGTRSEKPGLVRRVEQAVKDNADKVMAESGRAGVKLAKAWGFLYGLDPNASEAYRYAIHAVEAAAIPVVVPPTAKEPTLGTAISQMDSQKDWALPMLREHAKTPTPEVLVAMMRVLWRGQHDRHEGESALPGTVSIEEAKVAVGLAVALVQWFNDGLIQRKASTP